MVQVDYTAMQQDALRRQIEFYFSLDNLLRDIYLRRNMDANGWVPLSVVANFTRVRMLTDQPQQIVTCLAVSQVVEASPNNTALRPRENWK